MNGGTCTASRSASMLMKGFTRTSEGQVEWHISAYFWCANWKYGSIDQQELTISIFIKATEISQRVLVKYFGIQMN